MVNPPVCWLLVPSTYFPLFHSRWTLLGGLVSLVWFSILPSLVIPAPTPSSCISFSFGYGMLRFRPTYSKISQFFWIFGEPVNPLRKIDTEYETQIGIGMVPISVSL